MNKKDRLLDLGTGSIGRDVQRLVVVQNVTEQRGRGVEAPARDHLLSLQLRDGEAEAGALHRSGWSVAE
jgi:hypothetical protein